jgi:hypothetical protein
VDELLVAEVLALLRETRLSGLAFRMVRFSRSLMPALPSLYLAMMMSKMAFGRYCGLLLLFFCHWPSFGLSDFIYTILFYVMK